MPKAWDTDLRWSTWPRSADQVAKLPTQLEPDHEDAKRFDLLVLHTQLGRAAQRTVSSGSVTTVMKIASLLEDQQTIPVIKQQLELILDDPDRRVVGATSASRCSRGTCRKRLRNLVQLIERTKKGVIYSDFADEAGVSVEIDLPGTGGAVAGNEFVQFRKKAEHFLKENLGERVVAKVRSGEQLTFDDIAELQRILVAEGIGGDETFEEASVKAGSFGRFIRSIVGLDRSAAKVVFAQFLDDKRYSKNQISFVNLIIDELSKQGIVEPGRIYEQPFSGLASQGPEQIFVEADVARLFDLIKELNRVAV
jgi:type I restriction enzyme R subunit